MALFLVLLFFLLLLVEAFFADVSVLSRLVFFDDGFVDEPLGSLPFGVPVVHVHLDLTKVMNGHIIILYVRHVVNVMMTMNSVMYVIV
jgi:hypothetical protein